LGFEDFQVLDSLGFPVELAAVKLVNLLFSFFHPSSAARPPPGG
jgi:hypothetical protein